MEICYDISSIIKISNSNIDKNEKRCLSVLFNNLFVKDSI